ncbi:PREDICTED: uncharacterized protein LOC109585146 [Amphimedon queenslandica]|uniref:Lipocalin/cytosolic fatty-acid binding domain-containing protein n=1 Tax=Amphimedon queenslandica TaxID=400682 RepID=A0A1X7U0B2_AMPQE|nr:PREDICTED: uncharacterized protein LOC109585146 [Amphimedon queenslandica]|eukprot:XP_019856675.1 PREDICTED: uncharacterized protein LOC109585146 [Amphimedon queenslandica]
MKYLAVVVAALLFVAANAAPSRKAAAPACATTPAQWTGYIYEISFADAKLALRVSEANYDRDAKKLKLTDIDVKESAKKTITLLDYSTGTSYTSVEGQCTKGNVTGIIPNFGVPGGATADRNGAKYLGSSLPNLGVLVYEYYGTDSVDGDYYVTYTPIGDGEVCVPILRSLLTTSPLKEAIFEYTNITTTLPADPFSMPPGC